MGEATNILERGRVALIQKPFNLKELSRKFMGSFGKGIDERNINPFVK